MIDSKVTCSPAQEATTVPPAVVKDSVLDAGPGAALALAQFLLALAYFAAAVRWLPLTPRA